jgi:hypothetical protein
MRSATKVYNKGKIDHANLGAIPVAHDNSILLTN